MSLATGGFAFGGHLDEIEVCLLGQVQRDGSRDDAHLLALRADQGVPAGTRISSLIRGSSLMMTPTSTSIPWRGPLLESCSMLWVHGAGKARANMRSASADAYQFFASFLITRCISQSLGCLP